MNHVADGREQRTHSQVLQLGDLGAKRRQPSRRRRRTLGLVTTVGVSVAGGWLLNGTGACVPWSGSPRHHGANNITQNEGAADHDPRMVIDMAWDIEEVLDRFDALVHRLFDR